MDNRLITEDSVRTALQGISTAQPLESSPLLGMSAVRQRLLEEGLPESSEGKAWALAALLSDVVWAQLSRRRPAPASAASDRVSIDDERSAVADDFAVGDSELEAWSCLYYRFLAPSRLQVTEIAAEARPASVHGRKHITRRTNLGLSLLTAALRRLEMAAGAGLEGDSGRGPTTGTPPHNLPIRRSTFVGRARELALADELLDGASLVTLTGPGGVGKTRLAVQVAWDRLSQYADGVWFVELAAVSDPELVMPAIADTVGASEVRGHSLGEQVARELASASALLVIDNCEHVVASCAQAADQLLTSCPRLHILATSREPLGVEGETRMAVPPLQVPGDSSGMDRAALAEFPAVELFIDRSRSASPELDLDPTDVEALAQLCRRLDGMPLAIELAAARVRHMSVNEILQRLDDRFLLLSGGRRTDLTRHQTLRAAIDWSYDLLSAEERALFQRLAVFRGGWTIRAAECVCGGLGGLKGSVLDTLAQLVDKSLVVALAETPEARFDMLRSIRIYADEKLCEGDARPATVRSHLAWAVGLAEDAAPELNGPDQAEWLRRLSQEHDNFSAALEAGHSDEQGALAALRLAGALSRYWLLRGLLSEGRAQLQRALASPNCRDHTSSRAVALDGAGALAFNQGDYSSSRALHEESLAIRRKLGDDEGVAEALRNLGNVADEMGEYARAVELYEQALGMWRKLGNDWGEAAALNNLGLVAMRKGEYATATDRLRESLRMFEAQDARWAVGVTSANLADIAFDTEDTDSARAYYTESLRIAADLDDRDGIAYALTGLANVSRKEQDWHAARKHLEQSLGILKEMGDRQGIAEWLESAAMLASAEGRAIRAGHLLGAAEALRQEIDAPVAPKDQPAVTQLADRISEAIGEDGLTVAREDAKGLGWQAVADSAFDSDPDSLTP